MSPRIKKVLKRDKTGNMDWIPQINRKEESKLSPIKSFKLKQEPDSRSSNRSSSEDELIHGNNTPVAKINQSMAFENDSPRQKKKGPKSSGKSRKSKQRMRKRSNLEDIHDLLDDEESLSGSSSNSSFDSSAYNRKPRSKSFKKRSKGIKVIDGEKLSLDISHDSSKLPKIFNRQMIKYMQESDYSDGFSLNNSSLQSEKTPVDIKRDIRQDTKTPGLFIKKLDSRSMKTNTEDEENERNDDVHDFPQNKLKSKINNLKIDFLRQNSSSSNTRTLKSMETLKIENKLSVNALNRRVTAEMNKNWDNMKVEDRKEDQDDLSHYGTQRRMCKFSVQILKF